jgi:YVTN family beta-propeller protein
MVPHRKRDMKRIVALAAVVLVSSASAGPTGGTPVAFVTAEQQNELVAVELPSGRVLKRATLPADPQNVVAGKGTTTVVVGPRSGTVTLLDWRSLKRIKVFRGFGLPHLAALHPSGEWAYVTDDARGELTTIELAGPRIVSRIFVGAGAHHLAVSPSGRRAWIALGEQASEIAIVDLSRPRRPRLLHTFSPGFTAHDLTFSPDGRRVWVTSGVGDYVYALDARTGRRLFRVNVGPAPQHVAFSYPLPFAFATSGYGGRIVKIDPSSGRILASARTPYGSFNLASSGGLVVTTSLLNGRLTEFDLGLHRLSAARPARAARAVALTVWP